MLFGLNNELVADMKWRYYCVEQLEQLPHNFKERLKNIMILNSFTREELDRQKKGFMEMWQEMRPIIEGAVRMTFEEMVEII
jgi:hypothetical protein